MFDFQAFSSTASIMSPFDKSCRCPRLAVVLLVLATSGGCRTWFGMRPIPAAAVGAACQPVPRERDMVSLPPYVIEPPDILLIDALRIIPKEPFQIQPLDVSAGRCRSHDHQAR